jgi:prefoldin subunit 5
MAPGRVRYSTFAYGTVNSIDDHSFIVSVSSNYHVEADIEEN